MSPQHTVCHDPNIILTSLGEPNNGGPLKPQCPVGQ